MLTFHMKSRTHQTYFFFFFFNDTATTEIYTLSLHDALPISSKWPSRSVKTLRKIPATCDFSFTATWLARSEEHTSELQSRSDLVCRLLLEKKKTQTRPRAHDCRHRLGSSSHPRPSPPTRDRP